MFNGCSHYYVFAQLPTVCHNYLHIADIREYCDFIMFRIYIVDEFGVFQTQLVFFYVLSTWHWTKHKQCMPVHGACACMCVRECVYSCLCHAVCLCVRACVRACVHVCVCA